MSVKFRNDSHITICFECRPNYCINNIDKPLQNDVIIGPIINRNNCTKIFYNIEIMEKNKLYDICMKYFNYCMYRSKNRNIIIQFDINYKLLKKYCKIVHVCERESIEMTENDFLNDLDYMNDEIMKCKMNMDLMKFKKEFDKYNFYQELINNKQHTMFQLLSINNYNAYLDKISLVVNNYNSISIEQEKEIMNDIIDISHTIW